MSPRDPFFLFCQEKWGWFFWRAQRQRYRLSRSHSTNWARRLEAEEGARFFSSSFSLSLQPSCLCFPGPWVTAEHLGLRGWSWGSPGSCEGRCYRGGRDGFLLILCSGQQQSTHRLLPTASVLGWGEKWKSKSEKKSSVGQDRVSWVKERGEKSAMKALTPHLPAAEPCPTSPGAMGQWNNIRQTSLMLSVTARGSAIPPTLPPVSSRSPSLTPPLAAGAFEISLQRAGFGRCSSSFHREQRVGRARAEVALASAEDAGMKAAGGFPSSTALLLPSPSTQSTTTPPVGLRCHSPTFPTHSFCLPDLPA